jgi:hypothetical protein
MSETSATPRYSAAIESIVVGMTLAWLVDHPLSVGGRAASVSEDRARKLCDLDGTDFDTLKSMRSQFVAMFREADTRAPESAAGFDLWHRTRFLIAQAEAEIAATGQDLGLFPEPEPIVAEPARGAFDSLLVPEPPERGRTIEQPDGSLHIIGLCNIASNDGGRSWYVQRLADRMTLTWKASKDLALEWVRMKIANEPRVFEVPRRDPLTWPVAPPTILPPSHSGDSHGH